MLLEDLERGDYGEIVEIVNEIVNVFLYEGVNHIETQV